MTLDLTLSSLHLVRHKPSTIRSPPDPVLCALLGLLPCLPDVIQFLCHCPSVVLFKSSLFRCTLGLHVRAILVVFSLQSSRYARSISRPAFVHRFSLVMISGQKIPKIWQSHKSQVLFFRNFLYVKLVLRK